MPCSAWVMRRRPSKPKLGDHAHGEDARLAGDLRHHRGGAGTRAAAHAGGDEHHVGALQRLGHLIAALLGGLAAHVGVRAGALAAGELFADLDLIVSAGSVQRLLVRIYRHKVHTLGAAAYHAVDHVVAAAADAYDLDVDHIFRPCFQSESHVCSSCHNLYENDTLSACKCYILYCITEWEVSQDLPSNLVKNFPCGQRYSGINRAFPSCIMLTVPFSLTSSFSTTASR